MSSKLTDLIVRNWNQLKELPLNKPFTAEDVNAIGNDIKTWKQDGIIKQVDVQNGQAIYRVTVLAKQKLRDYEPTVQTPCGHRGIRNLGDGQYTCCCDDCDVVFSRSDAAAALEVPA